MKKKLIRRKLRRMRREQRELWDHMAEVECAVLHLLNDDADDGDEPDGGYECLAEPYGTVKSPKLKVVA